MTTIAEQTQAMRAYDRLRDVAWRLAWSVVADAEACCAAIEAAFEDRAARGASWDSDAAILVDVHRAACVRASALTSAH
ncbi:MAG: hypothetical protein JWM86_2839 [Thermoleophilia bacterium]|nr:hypothetical protein [Thermoleophilia bacterium]